MGEVIPSPVTYNTIVSPALPGASAVSNLPAALVAIVYPSTSVNRAGAAFTRVTVTSGPESVDTNTSCPSGVNFNRFAPFTSAERIPRRRLCSRSMSEIVPSCAFATHAS